MAGKEEVDHEHVSLLCSIQVGSPSVSLWYVLGFALRSGPLPDERRYISNHFIHSYLTLVDLFRFSCIENGINLIVPLQVIIVNPCYVSLGI